MAPKRDLACGLAMVLVLILGGCTPARQEEPAPATDDSIDPAAKAILARMAAYTTGLRRFSVKTQITLEDWLDSGHIAEHDISTEVTIQRPNRIRSLRRGDLIDQDSIFSQAGFARLQGQLRTLFGRSDLSVVITAFHDDKVLLLTPECDMSCNCL